MEKKLQKAAIYGFLFALGLAVLFVDYKVVGQMKPEVQEIGYMQTMDYFITLLKFAIVGSFICLFATWRYFKNRYEKNSRPKSYYVEMFFATFVIAIILDLLVNW